MIRELEDLAHIARSFGTSFAISGELADAILKHDQREFQLWPSIPGGTSVKVICRREHFVDIVKAIYSSNSASKFIRFTFGLEPNAFSVERPLRSGFQTIQFGRSPLIFDGKRLNYDAKFHWNKKDIVNGKPSVKIKKSQRKPPLPKNDPLSPLEDFCKAMEEFLYVR